MLKPAHKDYPYMYARISAKKAKLLTEQDYENLLKMQPNEIARRLGEDDYKQDMEELGSLFDGVELVELALMRNISRTMAEIIDYSPESIKPIISAYLRKYDILSFKRLLRWKKGAQKGNHLESFLVPVGRYGFKEFREMSEKSFEEIKESIHFPDSKIDYKSRVKDIEDIREIERELNTAYYEEMQLICDDVGSQWFTRFIRREVEYENLKIALRLKKYDLNENDIKHWLVRSEPSKIVKKVIEAKDFKTAVEEVSAEEGLNISPQDSMGEIEHQLEILRLQRSLKTLHTEPLGVTAILGYIVAKLIEIKNLRMMIRAKETGIQNLETIRKNLVLPR